MRLPALRRRATALVRNGARVTSASCPQKRTVGARALRKARLVRAPFRKRGRNEGRRPKIERRSGESKAVDVLMTVPPGDARP